MIVVMLCKPVFIALRVRYSVAISTQFFATFGHLCAARDEPRGNSACMVLKPHRHPRRNGVQKAGRMCEVGPPQAAVPPSRVLIRAGGAQREILLCEAAGCRRLKDESLSVLAAKLPCAGHDTSPFQAAGLGVINSRGTHKARDTP